MSFMCLSPSALFAEVSFHVPCLSFNGTTCLFIVEFLVFFFYSGSWILVCDVPIIFSHLWGVFFSHGSAYRQCLQGLPARGYRHGTF